MKEVKVYGTGCPKCEKLARNCKEAAEALGVEINLIKVTDLMDIMGAGIMMTPALAIDNKMMFSGKVASVDDLKKLLA